MRLMQCPRKSEHSFDGSVRIFLLILNELGYPFPLSQQAIFLAVFTSFSASPISLGYLQDTEKWVDAAIATKREVDWLRYRSVASYLCS